MTVAVEVPYVWPVHINIILGDEYFYHVFNNRDVTMWALKPVYYRPQEKFAKVMFSQVSVCPWGVSVKGALYPGGLCPG